MKEHLSSTEGGAIGLELHCNTAEHWSVGACHRPRKGGRIWVAVAAVRWDPCEECNPYAQSEIEVMMPLA